ncbi:alkaline phosphatase D family protein [Natronococcus wangiae]|uniref:alkaline phosphatase D family protein n=1 Tax=Natronococcus wangiae TaxID=3068275 RepID=UPI00273F3310|nr:alkaline phosphatase D family protein [Natronococcus sp. AD5]
MSERTSELADATRTTRRTVLEAAGATSAAALTTLFSRGAAARAIDPERATNPTAFEIDREAAETVYPQSIASGDPTPSGVVAWTRLSPAAYEGDEPMGIEVALDEEFETVVYRGIVPGDRIDPDHDYAVTVDLDGNLESDQRYFYRFVYDGDASRIGRCRTLPEPDASPDSVRFAVLSCNNYLQGYYGGLAHVADEDVDFIVHTGDFLYEYAGDGQQPGRDITLPSGKELAHTLDDFRHLHRTYRSDEFMRAALEQHTLIHTWDDHEIVNNRWWNHEADAPETASHPYGDDPERMRRLYAEGIKAMTEYVPLRIRYEAGDDGTLDEDAIHERFRLYRSFRFGDLVELFMTDERLYRTHPPDDEAGQRDTATPPSDDQDDADRTMLGSEQRRWFVDGVTESDATWKVWGNEVLNAALKAVNADTGSAYLNYDAWDGYEFERRNLMGTFVRNDVENFVTLTGDMHASIAAYLKEDYKDATESEYAPDGDDHRVGVEFMTPAVSSNNLSSTTPTPEGVDEKTVEAAVKSQNPHIEWFNWSRYGYSVVEFADDHCTYVVYDVDRTVDAADAPKRLLKAYRVPEGTTELQEYDGDLLGELL